MTGPRALLAGRLALLLDDDVAALDHLRASLAYSQKIRSRPFIAQSELWIADTLAKRGDASATVHAENALAIATELGMRGVAEHASSFVKSTPKTPRSRPPVHRALEVLREGETWTVAEGERRVVLKDTKGLAYLDALVRDPHREVHVLELVGIDERGDAGPLLDEKAKKEYRARAEALREEIEEAERFGDPTRAQKKREELDALATELARAVGLGGRDRRAASNAERARINVQRRLKDVIRRVGEQDSFLGRHLDASVKTGVFCTYAPTWPGT